MKKIHFKINGETVGTVDSLNINESLYGKYPNGGTIKKIKFDKISLFKSFHNTINNNGKMDFEFETDTSKWKAFNACIINYSYHKNTNDQIIVVDNVDFACASVVLVRNEKDVVMPKEKEPKPTDASSPEYQDMINKFAAAISKVTWIPVEGDECQECKATTLLDTKCYE